MVRFLKLSLSRTGQTVSSNDVIPVSEGRLLPDFRQVPRAVGAVGAGPAHEGLLAVEEDQLQGHLIPLESDKKTHFISAVCPPILGIFRHPHRFYADVIYGSPKWPKCSSLFIDRLFRVVYLVEDNLLLTLK